MATIIKTIARIKWLEIAEKKVKVKREQRIAIPMRRMVRKIVRIHILVGD